MSDQTRLKLIEENPIGNGLDAFRALFSSIWKVAGLHSSTVIDPLGQEDAQVLASSLLLALQILPVARLLRSKSGSTIRSDLLRLISAVTSDDFDFDRIKPLLKEALADDPQDAQIWDLVSIAANEPTPPPRSTVSLLQQTPWHHTFSSFVNSSETRQDVDRVLRFELGPLYVGLPHFCEAFFGGVLGLKAASVAVFSKCAEGDNALFVKGGWKGWPQGAKERDVLSWFGAIIPALIAFAKDSNMIPVHQRKLLALPRKPIKGSTAKRSMDIGFVDDDFAHKPESEEFRYGWTHILVPGELKNNPAADRASMAWVDLATCAREVLSTQDTRRFVMGFTLCGSNMRVWEFDRLGGTASEKFDINKDGSLQFVTAILGFLCMNEEELGFDPTIITSGTGRYIDIERNCQPDQNASFLMGS